MLLTPLADDASRVALSADLGTSLPSLAGYHVVRDAGQIPAIAEGHLYNYLLAGNGLFLHAQRRELTVLMRIAPAQVRGLPALRSRLRVRFPRVPVDLVREMVQIAADAARARVQQQAAVGKLGQGVVECQAPQCIFHAFALRQVEELNQQMLLAFQMAWKNSVLKPDIFAK